MAQELKHAGRVKSNGKRCLVAYRTLPGDAYNCLIVPTENLPDAYHDAIINLVNSPSGQNSYEFAEVMARSNFPDGSIMLAALHTQNRLIKVSTDQIEMIPSPGVSILLSELNQIIAEQRGLPVDDLSLKSGVNDKVKTTLESSVTTTPTSDAVKTTSQSVNEEIVSVAPAGTPDEQAKFFRSQADKLAKQAAEMRRKAEELVPTVKKKV
jgi:hypothetical protein